MRLQAAGFCPFHILPDVLYPAGVHGVVNKGTILKQFLEVATVKGMFDYRREAGPDFGLVAVADGLYQEITKQFTLELQFAEYVKNLPPE